MTEQTTSLHLLESLPPERQLVLPSIREEITSSSRKIVILDDDPTGTQTVRDLPVLTHWSKEGLREELLRKDPAFFILTNSRSLPEAEACRLAEEIGQNLDEVSRETGVETILISRSDSTLRGHFPAEVDAMARVMGKEKLPYLLVPFFLEGGRYTVGDVHYVQEGDQLVPAAKTPFAEDASFGFRSSNLRDWVEEKSGGRIPAETVVSVSIEDIRLGGPFRVAEILQGVDPEGACIVNAASYRDMEVLVAALLKLEKNGREFLYRTAASFVRTRTGQENRIQLLTKAELVQDNKHGGLFVIGSYVPKSSRQAEALFSGTDIIPVEVQVDALLDPEKAAAEIERAASLASRSLGEGRDTALFTSRKLITGVDSEASLAIGRTVSDSLTAIVEKIEVEPRYLVAKGGITSSDVATKGLGVKRAMVAGQVLPGVPVWKLGRETRYPGMSYIIFPGNVGEDDALVSIKRQLQ